MDVEKFDTPVANLAQRVAIKKMFTSGRDDFATPSWGIQMVCPICGFEYVHFEKAVLTSSDDYTAWEGRGDAIRIPMVCENGHYWTLRFGFHKGTVHFAICDDTSLPL